MKAATVKPSSGMQATPSMEAAASAVKTTATAVETAPTTAVTRLGCACECQLHECAGEDPSERE
jgi:hypothetical protein